MLSARLVFALGLALVLCACGGHALRQAQIPTETQAAYMARQLRELDALAAPEGVPPATWQQLKQSLRGILRKSGSKAALAAPTSAGSEAVLNLDAGTQSLSWGYACQGDYDQNGEVNVSDLTPIALHYGVSAGGGHFAANSIESVVDGDGNGEINIADLTPIGLNFGVRVRSYNVYSSQDLSDIPSGNDAPNGPGAQLLGSLELSAASGNKTAQRLSFTHNLGDPNLLRYFWVRPNDAAGGSGQDGALSTVINGSTYNQPPVAYMYQPNPFGKVPLTLDFNFLGSADADGTIMLYELDAEGDGTYEQSWTDIPPPVDHTYNTAGLYNCTLRVTDDDGATGTFVIQVEARDPANALPTAKLTADVTTGEVPLHVLFDASDSTDSDGTITLYEFDLDGDGVYEFAGDGVLAEHTYTNAGFNMVHLRVTDNSGGRSATAVNIMPTDAANLAPIAKLTAAPLTGTRPLTVQFDASKSIDTDGTITRYYWDFDGDSSPDLDTAGPYVSYTYNRQGFISPTVYVRDNDWEMSGNDTVTVQLTSGWQITTLDAVADTYETRIEVLSAGLPAPRPLVAYYKTPPARQILVCLGAADALSFGGAVQAAGSAQLYFDMGLVNGSPVIAFGRDGGAGVGGLCYCQAQDATAATWGPAQAVDVSDPGVAFDGVALDNILGFPGIVYLDGNVARYVRAQDVDGTTWGAPVALTTLGGVCRNPNLLDWGGRAQAIIGDLTGTTIFQLRAQDPLGTAWTEPLHVVASDAFNAVVSAAIVDGVPAFVYQSNSTIYLRKATDAGASGWQDPVVVYASPVICGFGQIVLCVIGGIPAVAFQNGESRLCYLEATDSSGTHWYPPETVDTWMMAGDALSMADFLGRPLLVYSGSVHNAPLRAAYLAEPTH